MAGLVSPPSLEPVFHRGSETNLATGDGQIVLTTNHRVDGGTRSTLWRIREQASNSCAHIPGGSPSAEPAGTPSCSQHQTDGYSSPTRQPDGSESSYGQAHIGRLAIDGRMLLVQTGTTMRAYDTHSGLGPASTR